MQIETRTQILRQRYAKMNQFELTEEYNRLSEIAYRNESDRPGADVQLAQKALKAMMIVRQYEKV